MDRGLGNAFLAQQDDVMDAVQRMRKKAQEKGNLKSTEQMKVETKVVESKQVIVVEQSNPQVVYVPSYDPVVVYGAPVYPYPPIYYPPPGYYAAGMAISFGVGLAMGAAWGGGWGYNCGWGGGNNNININNNNNFVNNSNRQNVNVIVPLSSPVAEEATAGSTIRSTEAELPIQIGPRQTSTAAQVVGLLFLTGKPMRGNNNLVSRAVADSRRPQWIAAVLVADNSRALATGQQAEATE